MKRHSRVEFKGVYERNTMEGESNIFYLFAEHIAPEIRALFDVALVVAVMEEAFEKAKNGNVQLMVTGVKVIYICRVKDVNCRIMT